MKQIFRTATLLSILGVIVAFFSISGCGVKKPPIPPRQVSPMAVTDLNKIIEQERLKLTWTIPKGKKPELLGFILYRSRVELTDADCKDCPVLFKRIGDILIKSQENGMMKYEETLEKGYKYIYKVITYATDGTVSTDSNFVEFTY